MIGCGGDALIDFVPVVAEGGEAAFLPRVGGSCLNVAIVLGRLGAPVEFIGGVSTDLFGKMIADHMANHGVGLGRLSRTDSQTTLAFVKMDGADARYAFYDEHSAARRWEYDPTHTGSSNLEALHIGSVTLINQPSAAAYETLLDAAREAAVISFDPNCRPTLVSDYSGYCERIGRLAAKSHLVRFSEEDFVYLYPDHDESEIVNQLLAAGVQLIFVSRGGNGASAYSRHGRLDVPALKPDIVDTIGAGDTFQGALLFALRERGLLKREALAAITTADLRAAMEFAVHAAALTCTRSGCEPPDLATLNASDLTAKIHV